ncbi:MAG: hypothetical protein JWN44_2538 [Myxococcales bacterium]|nr:hypothetical protein [Myxococcales bacterium]
MRLDERLRLALAPDGYNAWGVVARARYDAAAPPAWRTATLHAATRSIIVTGTGGRAHWDAFLRWLAVDPRARLAAEPHPLDAFTADRFGALASLLGDCRVVFPTFHAPERLDFMRLAELAGLGRPSELGILVGAGFGPWFGLRAAVFTPEELPDSLGAGPAPARECDGCAAPCRREPTPLARRRACVVGPDAAYDPLQATYHYDRLRGRRLLCEYFQVADELPPGAIY